MWRDAGLLPRPGGEGQPRTEIAVAGAVAESSLGLRRANLNYEQGEMEGDYEQITLIFCGGNTGNEAGDERGATTTPNIRASFSATVSNIFTPGPKGTSDHFVFLIQEGL